MTPENLHTDRPQSARPSYHQAVRDLSRAQKPAKGPAYSVYVNRWIGRRAAAGAYVLGLTPNMVTVVSAVFSAAGIGLIALTSTWAVLAAPLLAIGYMLDAADGQLARLRGGGSSAGEWLDHMADAVKVTSLHLAVLIHLYRFTDLADAWLLVPVGYTIVGVTTFFGYLLDDQLKRNRALQLGGSGETAGRSTSMLRSLLQLPIDYGLLCWAFVLIAWPSVFVAIYAVLFAASGGYLVLVLTKWYRDLRVIDAERSS